MTVYTFETLVPTYQATRCQTTTP